MTKSPFLSLIDDVVSIFIEVELLMERSPKIFIGINLLYKMPTNGDKWWTRFTSFITEDDFFSFRGVVRERVAVTSLVKRLYFQLHTWMVD